MPIPRVESLYTGTHGFPGSHQRRGPGAPGFRRFTGTRATGTFTSPWSIPGKTGNTAPLAARTVPGFLCLPTPAAAFANAVATFLFGPPVIFWWPRWYNPPGLATYRGHLATLAISFGGQQEDPIPQSWFQRTVGPITWFIPFLLLPTLVVAHLVTISVTRLVGTLDLAIRRHIFPRGRKIVLAISLVLHPADLFRGYSTRCNLGGRPNLLRPRFGRVKPPLSRLITPWKVTQSGDVPIFGYSAPRYGPLWRTLLVGPNPCQSALGGNSP